MSQPQSETPLTDAVYIAASGEYPPAGTGKEWFGRCSRILKHARSLELRLNKAVSQLHFPSHEQYVLALKQRDELLAIAKEFTSDIKNHNHNYYIDPCALDKYVTRFTAWQEANK